MSGRARNGLVWMAWVALLLSCATVMGQTEPSSASALPSASMPVASSPAPVRSGLSILDWLVLAAYAVMLLAIGSYYSRRSGTSDEYLRGGGNMKPSMVGISLFASLISAISYLNYPGEMIKNGPGLLWSVAAVPFVFAITGYLLIPYITRLPVTSAYQILEGRLGFGIRIMGSIMFLMIRLIWMSLLVYVAADKVIVTVMGWKSSSVPYVCAVMGLVTVIYTSRGGLKAVILTDCIQAAILFCGAILTILLITARMGSFGAWWPTEWASHWKPQPVFSLSPHVRLTIVGTLIGELVWWVCTCGSDQMAVQRYLATRDAKTARQSFLVTSVFNALVTGLLAILGFALLGYYRVHPDLAPAGVSISSNADKLFPHFMSTDLPIGIAGLVIAGLLSAAMGALSSGINSTCAVIVTDLIGPFRSKPHTETEKVALARAVALVIGIVIVFASLGMKWVPGNLVEVTSKTSNLFVVPLFGLFFMAMFVPWATPYGAAFGSLYGLAGAASVAFWDVFTGHEGLSFQWVMPTALVVNVVAGCLLSLLPTRNKSGRGLALWIYAGAAPLAAYAGWVAHFRLM